MIHLLIDYYRFLLPDLNRQQELDTCFYDNINNPNFYKVHIFSDDKLPYFSEKVIHNKPGDRLTYKDYFEYAKNNIPEGDIVVLSNSDIYFDDTISRVLNYDLDKHILALTRWASTNHPNPLNDGHTLLNARFIPYNLDYCSQDVWVFKNPLTNFENSDCKFKMGVLGCDNKIAYSFAEMGYIPLNPSLDIITYHHHATGDATRTYKRKWLPHPYLFVPTLL